VNGIIIMYNPHMISIPYRVWKLTSSVLAEAAVWELYLKRETERERESERERERVR